MSNYGDYKDAYREAIKNVMASYGNPAILTKSKRSGKFATPKPEISTPIARDLGKSLLSAVDAFGKVTMPAQEVEESKPPKKEKTKSA